LCHPANFHHNHRQSVITDNQPGRNRLGCFLQQILVTETSRTSLAKWD
jgi:hypothetical protein